MSGQGGGKSTVSGRIIRRMIGAENEDSMDKD